MVLIACLQLSAVAHLWAVISWFVSMMWTRVSEGAALPPAKRRKKNTLWTPNRIFSTICNRIFLLSSNKRHYCVWTLHIICIDRVYGCMDLPFVWRLRCLRGTGCCPPGRRLVAPTPSRSVEAGLFDLAKYIGADVWLRRFLLWPSLSIGLDLAFLLIVPGVGTKLLKPRKDSHHSVKRPH